MPPEPTVNRRDYFAGLAMQALINEHGATDPDLPRDAWGLADRLIDSEPPFLAGAHKPKPKPAAPAVRLPLEGDPMKLSDAQVLAVAPMAGNFSRDEVEAFCAGFRRCLRDTRQLNPAPPALVDPYLPLPPFDPDVRLPPGDAERLAAYGREYALVYAQAVLQHLGFAGPTP